MSRKEESECRNPSEEITSRRVEKLWLIMATYPSEDWPKQESLNAVTDLAEKVAYGILSQKDWANVMDAEEVAADVYVNVYKARRNVRRKDTAKSFRAYVWKAAQNQTYSHLRSREGSTDNTKAAKKDIVYASSIDADPHFQLQESDTAGNPLNEVPSIGRTGQMIGSIGPMLDEISSKLRGKKLRTYEHIRDSMLEPDDLKPADDLEEGDFEERKDRLQARTDRIVRFISEIRNENTSRDVRDSYAMSAGITADTAKKRIRDLKKALREQGLLLRLQEAVSLFLLLITGLHIIVAK